MFLKYDGCQIVLSLYYDLSNLVSSTLKCIMIVIYSLIICRVNHVIGNSTSPKAKIKIDTDLKLSVCAVSIDENMIYTEFFKTLIKYYNLCSGAF